MTPPPSARVSHRAASAPLLGREEEWRRLTGHPFVFALWAARAEVVRPGLGRPFRDSLALGLAEMGRLIDEAAAETGLAAAELERYLTRNLTFHLGAEERAGLEEFHRRAHAHGLIPEVEPVRLAAG